MKHFFRYIFFFTVSCLLFLPVFVSANSWDQPGFEETTEAQIEEVFFLGKVVEDPTEEVTTEFGETHIQQYVPVVFTSGVDTGKEQTLLFEVREGTPGNALLQKGDRVIVGKSMVGGSETYYISDVYRLPVLYILLGLFLLLACLFTGWGGIRALVGLSSSIAVIVFFIVPNMLAGKNPLVIGFLGTIAIAVFSIFIAHGFRVRTTIAFVSTLATIGVALLLSSSIAKAMHLFGLGTEEAFFLQAAGQSYNLQGILIAGIIIGTLGVLDDITTAQAAVVEELHNANNTFGIKELFRRAFSVGREHIISLVNTLILAYVGVSLPLLLLLHIYEAPFWIFLNSEIVMEELVRMLVGSTALLLAVPITTALGAWYFGRNIPEKNER